MQRMFQLTDWVEVLDGGKLPLPGEARKIVLQVNAPQETVLTISLEDLGSPEKFLALVKGRDTLEFYVPGNVNIRVDGDCYFTGTEMGEPAYEVDDDPEIFTRVAVRKQRNPELEALMHKQTLNFQRMLNQQLDERDKLYAARERTRERVQRQRDEAAAAAAAAYAAPDAGAEPAPAAAQQPDGGGNKKAAKPAKADAGTS